MSFPVRVACVQTCATPDLEQNLSQAEALIREAAGQGAGLVALPEAFDFLAPTAPEMHAYAQPEESHLATLRLKSLAKELSVWILAGSVSTRSGDGAVVNRSLVINPEGAIIARYDKIHLFDVDLPAGGVVRESDFYRPGERAVVADTPWGGLGLTICYDVRFPQLHRALAEAGAGILAVPAAFSSVTGPLHWEALLRARAIETGSFVIASAASQRVPRLGTRSWITRMAIGSTMIASSDTVPGCQSGVTAGSDPACIREKEIGPVGRVPQLPSPPDRTVMPGSSP